MKNKNIIFWILFGFTQFIFGFEPPIRGLEPCQLQGKPDHFMVSFPRKIIPDTGKAEQKILCFVEEKYKSWEIDRPVLINILPDQAKIISDHLETISDQKIRLKEMRDLLAWNFFEPFPQPDCLKEINGGSGIKVGLDRLRYSCCYAYLYPYRLYKELSLDKEQLKTIACLIEKTESGEIYLSDLRAKMSWEISE